MHSTHYIMMASPLSKAANKTVLQPFSFLFQLFIAKYKFEGSWIGYRSKRRSIKEKVLLTMEGNFEGFYFSSQ